MICKRARSGLLVLFITFCAVSADDAVIKGSLTFVIDDTASMWDEIKQVKDEVNIIFENVLSSMASQIEDFVIVTFNDPTTDFRVRTTDDREKFRRTLAAITPHSERNHDCPELAMSGIKLGLENSLSHSYLFVFTDASAKDYHKFEYVKSLSQKKQSQIVFVLTGDCIGIIGHELGNEQVYYKLAEATSGQVFRMTKNDVKEILKYIEESITGMGSKVKDVKFPPGYGNNLTFDVDPYTDGFLISTTGDHPVIGDAVGPGGSRPTTTPIISGKAGMAVSKVTGAKPGEHYVPVGSKSETHAVLTTKSTINFRLGFNVFKPKSIEDTVARPAPKGDVFMGVKLLGTGVKLETVKIVDINDAVIEELKLELVDEKNQFYVTPSFSPPASTTLFGVFINGHDISSKRPVTRMSQTRISRQDLSTDAEVKVNTAPTVKIGDDPSITLYVDDPLELSCKVHAYPEPEIIWKDKDLGIEIPAETKMVDVPYDSVSILKLDKITKNTTYQCLAKNSFGRALRDVKIIAKRRFYFDVIETPKDLRIEYAKEGKLACKIDAYPKSATISWYKDGEPLSSSSRIEISTDQSVVTLKDMQPGMEGKYKCEARNDRESREFHSNVEIFGVEKPVINKSVDVIHVTESTIGELFCRLLKGIPKPNITWTYRGSGKEERIKETGETIQLKDIHRHQSGRYTCTAQNVLGTDSHETEVIVEYPPQIQSDVKEMKIVNGEDAKLTCDVVGLPAPTVYWTYNSIQVTNTTRTRIDTDNSLIIKTTEADTGHYACHADNKLGNDKKDIFLEVYEKPDIDKSVEKIRVREKTKGQLSCRLLKGIPKPNITWTYRGSGKGKRIKETGETIQLKDIRRGQSGRYICTAQNVFGTDSHETEVIVEYPPEIKSDVKKMKIVDGDEAKLTCDVVGEPAPTAYWTFDSINVTITTRKRITTDYSLIIKTTLNDTGHYVCHADNKLGKDKRKVFLRVYVPVTIKEPKSSLVETLVGRTTILNCVADGYPKPDIKWTFHRTRGAPGEDVTSSGHPALMLQRLQLKQQGFYTCHAENAISGSANITYEVKVYAPPTIEPVYTSKLFEAIDGDLLLRIPCKATGSPTPTITWQKEGLNLRMGSGWFDMENDGTLIIKNIDRKSEGRYVCLAENSVGHASDCYNVIVKDILSLIPAKTLRIPEGESIEIKCDIPHGPMDQLRWFKDGKVRIERESELYLFNVTRSDDGIYTCRVSNFLKPMSIATKLVIGFKPIFSTEVKETIEFVHGASAATLDCEAYGEPREMNVTWTHDGVPMAHTDMSYFLIMALGATGIYECEVSNKFGSIRRSFNVTSRDCILDIKKYFVGKHPIMFSLSGAFSKLQITDNYMKILHKDHFYLRCPSGFVNPELSLHYKIMAYCERDNMVKIAGKLFNFADIKCNKQVKPDFEFTEQECFGDNTEYLTMGFRLTGNYIMEAYTVCFDRENDVPLFTKHQLSPQFTDIPSSSQWYSSSDTSTEEFEELYNCRRQLYDVSMAIRKPLPPACCFGRRQLVNSHDLLPGTPVTVTFEYKNVVPHWSSCNSKNWDDLENLVRNLAKTAGRYLTVFTGTSNAHDRYGKPSVEININNGGGRNQTIPPYLWKVIQDPATDSSLAIVQVNIPKLTPEEAKEHTLCTDICNNIDWMSGPDWHDLDKGYTYCCNMREFEHFFGYTRPITSMKKVLFDASFTPDSYLII